MSSCAYILKAIIIIAILFSIVRNDRCSCTDLIIIALHKNFTLSESTRSMWTACILEFLKWFSYAYSKNFCSVSVPDCSSSADSGILLFLSLFEVKTAASSITLQTCNLHKIINRTALNLLAKVLQYRGKAEAGNTLRH